MKHLQIILITWLLLIMTFVISAQDSCGLDIDVSPGNYGLITPGDANNLRVIPGASGELTGQIAGNAWFEVLSNAACSGGFTWLEIDSAYGTGWTVISNNDEVFVTIYEGAVISESGVSLILPDELADAVSIEIIDGDRGFPAYLSITFEGYIDPGANPYRVAQIRIFVADDFEETNSMATGAAQVNFPLMIELLNSQGDLNTYEINDIPEFYPGAAQMIYASPYYVPFSDGMGYRFLAAYAQNTIPISNEILEYRFQGFTWDDIYFVDASFPIDAPENFEFPDYEPVEVAQAEDNGAVRYNEYVTESSEALEALDNTEFIPNLRLIDALLASLQIEEPFD